MQIVLSLGAGATPALVLWGRSGAVHGLGGRRALEVSSPRVNQPENELVFTKEQLD